MKLPRLVKSQDATTEKRFLQVERKCPKCGVTKKAEHFGRRGTCKWCTHKHSTSLEQREYQRLYRLKHRDRILPAKRVSETARRRLIAGLIDTHKKDPCSDCGVSYPPFVMDFDHRDPESKRFALAKARRTHTKIEDIKAEIAKCDLVCANCHRYRTNRQLEAKRIERAS